MHDVNNDGTLEKDMVRNHWDLFAFKRPTSLFTITTQYIARPDLIALKTLGDMSKWWIILKCNPEIIDVWNDLVSGSLLVIPHPQDIDDWVSAVRAKQQTEEIEIVNTKTTNVDRADIAARDWEAQKKAAALRLGS